MSIDDRQKIPGAEGFVAQNVQAGKEQTTTDFPAHLLELVQQKINRLRSNLESLNDTKESQNLKENYALDALEYVGWLLRRKEHLKVLPAVAPAITSALDVLSQHRKLIGKATKRYLPYSGVHQDFGELKVENLSNSDPEGDMDRRTPDKIKQDWALKAEETIDGCEDIVSVIAALQAIGTAQKDSELARIIEERDFANQELRPKAFLLIPANPYRNEQAKLLDGKPGWWLTDRVDCPPEVVDVDFDGNSKEFLAHAADCVECRRAKGAQEILDEMESAARKS